MGDRGHAAKRKEELPPEDSLLIRLLLHLLKASHWGCREISVACHYACRSDFSFTLLAYRSTIWFECLCVSSSEVILFFLSLSVRHTPTESCQSYWERKTGVQADRNVLLLVVRCVNSECVDGARFPSLRARLVCFMGARGVRWRGYIFLPVFTIICGFSPVF